MAVGSMHAGTRALVATSGGGFALMTETVSLAGMVEVPLVIVIVQRPGPATGLPTWTTQGDVYLAMHAGHGEFPRIVIACSDPESCFELIQHALNMAEKYQTFVAVLSEKVIAEARVTVAPFAQNTVPIERGLVQDDAGLKALQPTDRYKITENGVSKRWVPGRSEAAFCANSDEHLEDGTLTEDAGPSKAMVEKRLRKLEAIKRDLPKPQIFGPAEGADISFVGWGSTKNVMRDVLAHCEAAGVKVNYLHYDYLWPLDEAAAARFFETNPNVNLLEGNATAQFGTLLEEKTGKRFRDKFLKYDGRPFFFEEVLGFIDRQVGLPLNFK
jgi:2-oxoglutarate ferredoxin oxidoreductase subunit alpha